MLLAAAPFIVLLFVSSSKYMRSLKAIVGVGDNALAHFVAFLLIFLVLASGFLAARRWVLGTDSPGWLNAAAWLAIPVHFVILPLIVFLPSLTESFLQAGLYHAVNEYESTLIDRTGRPWVLTPEARVGLTLGFQAGLSIYGSIFFLCCIGVLRWGERVRLQAGQVFQVISGILLFYLLFVTRWEFATGIAVTFRATVFAYVLAAILGLIWSGLQTFRQTPRTTPVYATISLVLLAVAAFFWAQPRDTYVLVGSTDARIAIIKGTPQSLADTIRFGEYPGGGGQSLRIRNVPDVPSALEQVDTANSVSGTFIPVSAHDGRYPVIWETDFLPSDAKTPAIVFTVIGAMLLVLTLGGAQHGLHPLAVGSEFFVDTIRGIPMLVIILYIGLPLSGAVKEASSGTIDLPNMTRGIIAIAVGYSAYMAEIFRAGIEAVPVGQTEAGKSLGFTRFQMARLIILPQALRIVVPPLGNEFIAMIKDTSLLSILSVRDVTQRTREFQASSFLPFAPFNTAAILYVVITLACASFLKWIERRYEPGTG